MNVFDDLTWRGLVHQTSGADELREHLNTAGRVMYCGFDPTAQSLHIGNMVPLLALMRFAKAGHKPLALLGGATGLIGDPSGKDKERQLSDASHVAERAERIGAQIRKLFTDNGESIGVVNNLDWIGKLSAIELLRDVGKHFTVNYMLAKDSVKGRIDREESGISYTEFSYMILQGYDFYHLRQEKDCTLQIGGGDQFGNITAGLELIRKKSGTEAFAMTFPLITTASGAKFGKSEKGAIFLDPEMTSPYAFYQYWVNVDDRDVVNYLKYFTFLSQEEIAGLETAVAERPHLREAQRTLAEVMTTMVHGVKEVEKIKIFNESILSNKGQLKNIDPVKLSEITKMALKAGLAAMYAMRGDIKSVVKLVTESALSSSASQARRDIAAGSIRINDEVVTDDYTLHKDKLLKLTREHHDADGVLILRKGKKNVKMYKVTLVDEDE